MSHELPGSHPAHTAGRGVCAWHPAGAARQRFERLLRYDAALRETVQEAARRWNVLVETLPPIQPSAAVWRNIQRRIARCPRLPARPWHRLGFWRGWALVTSALAAILVLYIGVAPLPVTYVVVITDDAQARASWLLSAAATGQEIRVSHSCPATTTTRPHLPTVGQAPRRHSGTTRGPYPGCWPHDSAGARAASAHAVPGREIRRQHRTPRWIAHRPTDHHPTLPWRRPNKALSTAQIQSACGLGRSPARNRTCAPLRCTLVHWSRHATSFPRRAYQSRYLTVFPPLPQQLLVQASAEAPEPQHLPGSLLSRSCPCGCADYLPALDETGAGPEEAWLALPRRENLPVHASNCSVAAHCSYESTALAAGASRKSLVNKLWRRRRRS